jgi:hypothetical protein
MDLRLTITAYSGLAAPPVAVVPGKAATNPMKPQDGSVPPYDSSRATAKPPARLPHAC